MAWFYSTNWNYVSLVIAWWLDEARNRNHYWNVVNKGVWLFRLFFSLRVRYGSGLFLNLFKYWLCTWNWLHYELYTSYHWTLAFVDEFSFFSYISDFKTVDVWPLEDLLQNTQIRELCPFHPRLASVHDICEPHAVSTVSLLQTGESSLTCQWRNTRIYIENSQTLPNVGHSLKCIPKFQQP